MNAETTFPIPTTLGQAIDLVKLATSAEEMRDAIDYDIVGMYYSIGYAILNGVVTNKQMAESTGKSTGFFSQCKKIAKAVDESDEFRKAWTNGKVKDLNSAYDMACKAVGKVATTREVYLEDLEAKRAELVAKLAEIDKAMKTAKRKPVKVAKAK